MDDNEFHAHHLNAMQALDWGNMDEDEPLQSWEAMDEAAFEAATAKNNEECCFQLNKMTGHLFLIRNSLL